MTLSGLNNTKWYDIDEEIDGNIYHMGITFRNHLIPYYIDIKINDETGDISETLYNGIIKFVNYFVPQYSENLVRFMMLDNTQLDIFNILINFNNDIDILSQDLTLQKEIFFNIYMFCKNIILDYPKMALFYDYNPDEKIYKLSFSNKSGNFKEEMLLHKNLLNMRLTYNHVNVNMPSYDELMAIKNIEDIREETMK